MFENLANISEEAQKGADTNITRIITIFFYLAILFIVIFYIYKSYKREEASSNNIRLILEFLKESKKNDQNYSELIEQNRILQEQNKALLQAISLKKNEE